MFCRQCGKEIKDGAKFCPYCGEAQPQQRTISGVQSASFTGDNIDSNGKAKAPSNKSHSKGFVKIIAVLLALVMIICTVFCFFAFTDSGETLAAKIGESIGNPATVESAMTRNADSQDGAVNTLIEEIKSNLQFAQEKVEQGNYEEASAYMEAVSDKTEEAYSAGAFTAEDLCLIGYLVDNDGSNTFGLFYYEDEKEIYEEYDSEGSKVESYGDYLIVCADDANNRGARYVGDVTSYDGHGNITESELFFSDENGRKSSGSIYNYTYDAQGNILTKVEYVYDEYENPPCRRIESTYDTNGNCLSQKGCRISDGVLYISCEYTYDSYGNLAMADQYYMNVYNESYYRTANYFYAPKSLVKDIWKEPAA